MSLSQKIAQRDALDREISEAERNAAAAFALSLDDVREAVGAFAASRDMQLEVVDRKNVTTLVLGGELSVSLGYPKGEYRPFLSVTTRHGVAEFGWVPPPHVVTGFVSLLLGEKDNGND